MKILFLICMLLSSMICFATDYDWTMATRMGSATGADKAYQCETDTAGNIYITGTYTGEANFGNQTLQPISTSSGETDIFLAKFSPQGDCLWVRRAGSGWWDHSFALTIDDAGNIWIGGVVMGFGGSTYVLFGDTPYYFGYGYAAFVARFDAQGNLLGVSASSAASNPSLPVVVNDIVHDAGGSVYATGYYYGNLSFGSYQLNSQNDSYACFVCKLSPTGSWLWASKLDLPGSDTGAGIACDQEGVFVTGNSYGGGTFLGQEIPSAGAYDAFAGKLDHDGNWQWAKFYGGSGNDNGRGICTDGFGSVFVTGLFNGTCNFGGSSLVSLGLHNGFVMSLDQSGNTLWVKRIGSSNGSSAMCIVKDGDAYAVTGDYNSGLYLENQATIGGSGIYWARYNEFGEIQNIIALSVTNPLSPTFIHSDAYGKLYLGGAFNGNLNAGTYSLNSSGLSDAYFLRCSPRVELNLDIICLEPGELSLMWQAVPGAVAYRIYASDLPEGQWDLLEEIPANTNFYELDSSSNLKRFYRLTYLNP